MFIILLFKYTRTVFLFGFQTYILTVKYVLSLEYLVPNPLETLNSVLFMISAFNVWFISTSAFTFGSIQGKLGGFVLVSNADAVDPHSPEGCDVAEIIKLYETGKVDFAAGHSGHFHIYTCFDSWHDNLHYLKMPSLLLWTRVSGLLSLFSEVWNPRNLLPLKLVGPSPVYTLSKCW
jgi:hypothetical protein